MIITFSQLGNFGRLGNQMFQYALIKSVATNIGARVVIPTREHEIKKLSLDCGFRDIKINDMYKEKAFTYDPGVFSVKSNMDFSGYFQSYKYFQNIDNSIRQEFKCSEAVEKNADDNLKNLGNVVGVHVRRTDYLSFPKVHPFPGKVYYDKAMNYFRKLGSFVFMICSDDMNWCKNNIVGNDVMYSNNDKYIDLAMLYKSKHNIVANSSFSWWGGWLNNNKDKIVIYPKRWFGENGPKVWNDLIPKQWVGL